MPNLYVKLDTNFPDDDKIIEVGLEGAGLYAMACCRAKALLSDGVLKRNQLRRLGADDALIDRLIDVGLFVPHAVDAASNAASNADDAVRIAAWLERNESADSLRDPQRGEKMAHDRWHVKPRKPKEGCRFCFPPKPQVNADACSTDAQASPTAMQGDAGLQRLTMPKTETETETEEETETKTEIEKQQQQHSPTGRDPRPPPSTAAAAAAQSETTETKARAVADRLGLEQARTRQRNGDTGIRNPAGLGRSIARDDIWPEHATQLVALANTNPGLDIVQLTELAHEFSTPNGHQPDPHASVFCATCGTRTNDPDSPHDQRWCDRVKAGDVA